MQEQTTPLPAEETQAMPPAPAVLPAIGDVSCVLCGVLSPDNDPCSGTTSKVHLWSFACVAEFLANIDIEDQGDYILGCMENDKDGETMAFCPMECVVGPGKTCDHGFRSALYYMGYEE